MDGRRDRLKVSGIPIRILRYVSARAELGV
jgi:hypothetical protein